MAMRVLRHPLDDVVDRHRALVGDLADFRADLDADPAGVEEGGEISVYYDPMIAKLIAHGPHRKLKP